jgi:tetratricopeptide (TPR) repeat protein
MANSAPPCAPDSAAAVVRQLADDFPRLGMTVRRLLREIDSRSGGRRALAGLTTDQVKDLVFVPLTAATQLSLCEQLQAEGDEGVGLAMWFVSHAWMYTFLELLEALEHFFASKPQGLDTLVWLDLVSTSQHGTFSRPPQWWAATFQTAIQSMGNMVMVMCPWDKPVTLTRAWCILELYACCSSSTACCFEVALPDAQRRQIAEGLASRIQSFEVFLANVDSKSSDCSRESDRQSIFAAVRASVGFAGLDAVVRRTLTSWMVRQLQLKIDDARAIGDDRLIAFWLSALGRLHIFQGMHNDAVRLLQEAVQIRKQALGPEHYDCLVSMSNLARAYGGRGEFARAAALEEEVLPCGRHVWGEESEHSLTSMNNLASYYFRLCDYSRAAALFNETFTIRRRVFGPENIDTLRTHGNLAEMCYLKEDFERAEPMFDEALALLNRVHGQQHPATLYMCLRFHLLLLRTGRVSQAQPLIAANCNACASVLGLSHPRSILCVFVRALGLFYAAEINAQGLAAALQTSRDALDSGGEIDTIEREYAAAVVMHRCRRKGQHD